MAYFAAFVIVFLAISRSSLAWFDSDCSDVTDVFSWCESFVDGVEQTPSDQCCNSLRNLNTIVKQEDQGATRIYQCIENMKNTGDHPSYQEDRIADLYNYCQIHLSFPISEHMDCYSINN
ncbi:protein ARABIDOPSIS THALIANA ANTHER 7-like [Lycium barbarum]|uniref:protein ARABIDOPSIS THALIANA ANTHER 7-like n=1 Tax=Lycium barbarum TaxID=112863 RepID=UPI00293E1937|nr:protein ARABIDOPSIS THALIANA ANTHER 7-like [Lycium barbarum]